MSSSNETRKARKRLPFSYPGSKARMIHFYEPYFPAHHNFVSVFGGTGSEIGLKSQPSRIETFNDLDSHVSNVFSVLRKWELSEELIWRIENTANGRQVYDECFDVLIEKVEPPSVQHAWAFLVCGNTGFVAKHPRMKRDWGPDKTKNRRRRIVDLPDVVRIWRDRFRQVQLENLPWQQLLRKYDHPSAFFFVDPPYLPSVISAEYYVHELSMEEHGELLDALLNVQGHVMLCGYDSELYNDRLSHWRKASRTARTCIPSKNEERENEKRVENIWMNYEADGTRIPTKSKLIEMCQLVAEEAGGSDASIH